MTVAEGSSRSGRGKEGDFNHLQMITLDFMANVKLKHHLESFQAAYSDMIGDISDLFVEDNEQTTIKSNVTEIILDMIYEHFVECTSNQDVNLIREFINNTRFKLKVQEGNQFFALDNKKFVAYLNSLGNQTEVMIMLNVDPILFDPSKDVIDYTDFTHFRYNPPFPAPAPGTAVTQGPPSQLTPQAKFRQLLQQCNVMPIESVMTIILSQFSSRALLVDTPELAYDLYMEAALLPRSATREVLEQEKGIAVAGLFLGADPSRAVLLHAHEKGIPRILKVARNESIRHEWDVFSAVASSSHSNEETFLVNLQLLEFESTKIKLVDFEEGHSNLPTPRCGLLMRHFQGTLAKCNMSNISLPAHVLLCYGKNIQKALSTLHKAGFCHLDVKPSNMFLFEGACYLGDYGAAVKTGSPIRECTMQYYPTDGDLIAKEETDMYLLAVTLLELLGTIPWSYERDTLSKAEIHEKIASVETYEIQSFLTSLFNEVP